MIKVASVFNSIQGEGVKMGVPTTFIRLWTQDCFPNKKKCRWCDTIFKDYYKKNLDFNDDFLSRYIHTDSAMDNICITGGEPFAIGNKELLKVVTEIHHSNIEIETNGAYFTKDRLDVEMFSIFGLVKNINISPKLNAGVEYDYDFDTINLLMQIYRQKIFFKFVVKDEKDMYNVFTFLRKVQSYGANFVAVYPRQIYLMPLSPSTTEDKRRIVDFCLEHGYNYSARLHEDIFESEIDM